MADDSMRVEATELPELSNEDPFARPSALRINAGGRVHLFVPVIWSRLRLRTAYEATDPFQFRLHERLVRGSFLFLLSSINAFRCIPKARGRLRQSLVSVVAVLYAVAAPGFAVGAFYLLVLLTVWGGSPSEPGSWWRVPAMFCAISLLAWPVTKVLMVFDFVGDVVRYVGNPSHREAAETRLIQLVGELASRHPDARLVVIGHSLGSVLVTHAVLRHEAKHLGERMHLVTMGSPLNTMASFFSCIRSPQQLADDYRDRGIVVSWMNLWRDADTVGQRLGAAPTDRFSERSLGNGAHSNYWSDARCWTAVIKHLSAVHAGSRPGMTVDLNGADLTPAETHELAVTRRQAVEHLVTLGTVLTLGAFFLVRALLGSGFLEDLSTLRFTATATMTVASSLLFIGCFVVVARSLLPRTATQREQLARFRLTRRLSGLLYTAAVLVGVAAAVTAGSVP